jgi:hypothetical protein
MKDTHKHIVAFSVLNRITAEIYNSNPCNISMTPIDLSNEEILSFLKNLELNKVRYLLVGGLAMAFHGFVRATNDLDLWIEHTPSNIESFKKSLSLSGVAGILQVRDLTLTPGFGQINIGDTGFTIDPMKHLKAFSEYDFDGCYTRAKISRFQGVALYVIDAQDMLEEKLANNRPKDQADIEHLKALNLKGREDAF